jgi:ubiquitin-conjugating enzyme E2 S
VWRVKLALPADFPQSPPKGERCVRVVASRPRRAAAHAGARCGCARACAPFSPLPFRAGFFLTKIFHPNISKAGEICVNTLKRDWKEDISLGHIMAVVRCLLINPFPESALNEDAAKLFMEDYAEYAKQARLMCEIHARPKLADRIATANAEAEPAGGSSDSQQQKKLRAGADEQALLDKKKAEKKKSLKRL